MHELKQAIKNLGFPKTGNKFVFNSDLEEEEQLSRCMTIMSGLIYLMQTHFLSFYERTAMIDEFKVITNLFQTAQKRDNKNGEGKEQCEAICMAAVEMADHAKKRAVESARENGMDQTYNMVDEQVVMMKIATVAKAMAITACYILNDDELIEAKRKGEPPPGILNVVVKTLKTAYVARPSDNLNAVFTMHARTQVNRAIDKLFKKRNLSL